MLKNPIVMILALIGVAIIGSSGVLDGVLNAIPGADKVREALRGKTSSPTTPTAPPIHSNPLSPLKP